MRSNHLAQVYDASSNRNKYNKPCTLTRWFCRMSHAYLTMRCLLRMRALRMRCWYLIVVMESFERDDMCVLYRF
jgi:hypothetical protein